MKSQKPEIVFKKDSGGRWRDGNGRFASISFKNATPPPPLPPVKRSE